jgi:hypothetical protein
MPFPRQYVKIMSPILLSVSRRNNDTHGTTSLLNSNDFAFGATLGWQCVGAYSVPRLIGIIIQGDIPMRLEARSNSTCLQYEALDEVSDCRLPTTQPRVMDHAENDSHENLYSGYSLYSDLAALPLVITLFFSPLLP